MKGSPEGQVSVLLQAWSNGDQSALDKLTPIVYGELRRLARYCMKGERRRHSLQTTALVNEAYLKLADCKRSGQCALMQADGIHPTELAQSLQETAWPVIGPLVRTRQTASHAGTRAAAGD